MKQPQRIINVKFYLSTGTLAEASYVGEMDAEGGSVPKYEYLGTLKPLTSDERLEAIGTMSALTTAMSLEAQYDELVERTKQNAKRAKATKGAKKKRPAKQQGGRRKQMK